MGTKLDPNCLLREYIPFQFFLRIYKTRIIEARLFLLEFSLYLLKNRLH